MTRHQPDDFLAHLISSPESPCGPLEDFLRECDRWTWDECLRAVCSVPASDGLRLMAARWLEEHSGEVTCGACKGSPRKLIQTNPYVFADCKACRGTGRVSDSAAARAEFIRVQCELARLDRWVGPDGSVRYTPCPGSMQRDDYQALRRREGGLFHVLQDDLNPLPGWGMRVGSDMKGGNPCVLWLDRPPVPSVPRDHVGAVVRRGFIESVTLTAADWLAYADALYWHPGQTVPCPVLESERACAGGRPFRHFSNCPACRGEGTVPRPFVPTAQPIRAVTLTLPPGDEFSLKHVSAVPGRENHLGWVSDRWPGITFLLTADAYGGG